MGKNKLHVSINQTFLNALSSIATVTSENPCVIARRALDAAAEKSLGYEKNACEEYAWEVIYHAIQNSNRLYRKDIVNGEIVQLCGRLKFYASIYEDETSKTLNQAHDLICALVNADCLMKIFESEKMLEKYEKMKAINRRLSNRTKVVAR